MIYLAGYPDIAKVKKALIKNGPYELWKNCKTHIIEIVGNEALEFSKC